MIKYSINIKYTYSTFGQKHSIKSYIFFGIDNTLLDFQINKILFNSNEIFTMAKTQ